MIFKKKNIWLWGQESPAVLGKEKWSIHVCVCV